MTFLEKLRPHLKSDDLLIQETALHMIHDYPFLPDEWTNELLYEAFTNSQKASSILIYIGNQHINEEAVKLLIEHLPKLNESRQLAENLLVSIEAELALKYKESLENYINNDLWSLYELMVNGTEEYINSEYEEMVNALETADSFQYDDYIKAKKLAKWIVKKGWVLETEIDQVIQKELNDQWFSFNGILNVYMAGLLNLKKYIPTFASLLERDDDVLLDEVAIALIRFQSDEVIEAVRPYLLKEESLIFASSIVENIKTGAAVQALREAYRQANQLEDQDLLIEALCHHLSLDALPEISTHMDNEYTSNLVDIEMTAYSYYSILGLKHPDLKEWKRAAMGREREFKQGMNTNNVLLNTEIRNDNKVGRNDPCPCGSGKKYKKCCGK